MTEELNYTIEVCQKENLRKIIDGINEYNFNRVPALAKVWTPLEFVAKDKAGIDIGGILGGIGCWNGLEINVLWVKEDYRRKGLGSHLLKYIEKIALNSGATISMLDTFDFQAEGFYLKNGYEVIGEITDFPKGHKRIYFAKRFE